MTATTTRNGCLADSPRPERAPILPRARFVARALLRNGAIAGLMVEELACAGGHPARSVDVENFEGDLAFLEALLELPRLPSGSHDVVELEEECGLRAWLLLTALDEELPPTAERARVAGASMSTEECFYWYAKCLHPGSEGARGRRALRVLLGAI